MDTIEQELKAIRERIGINEQVAVTQYLLLRVARAVEMLNSGTVTVPKQQ